MILMLKEDAWKTDRDYHEIRDASRFGEAGGGRIFPFSSEKKSRCVTSEGEGSRRPLTYEYHCQQAQLGDNKHQSEHPTWHP